MAHQGPAAQAAGLEQMGDAVRRGLQLGIGAAETILLHGGTAAETLDCRREDLRKGFFPVDLGIERRAGIGPKEQGDFLRRQHGVVTQGLMGIPEDGIEQLFEVDGRPGACARKRTPCLEIEAGHSAPEADASGDPGPFRSRRAFDPEFRRAWIQGIPEKVRKGQRDIGIQDMGLKQPPSTLAHGRQDDLFLAQMPPHQQGEGDQGCPTRLDFMGVE